jgi:glutamate synthase (NADPH) small chain
MKNMRPTKTPMGHRPADERVKDFTEVTLGYTEDEAVDEAMRCLFCKHHPCVSGCPVGIDIPGFIKKITERDFEGAYGIITKDSSLPAVCGRVCPQETQCEARCVRGIKGEAVAIGRLERFVADWHMAHHPTEESQKAKGRHRVAVIGSGPAGLSCAKDLADAGTSVTVFEALHVAGGVLVYGIPEFRLPKGVVEDEITRLSARGVTFETNVVIGKTLTVDDLFDDGFEAVFIATGAGLPKFLGVEGENLNGVYSANEFLTRVNLMKAYETNAKTPVMKGTDIIVVGGGNVAMDAARSALRLGARSVRVVYRRSFEELPARLEEVIHAKEEGIIFSLLSNPMRIMSADGRCVSGMEVEHMELGEPDASGRRRPVPIPGSAETYATDMVIIAIGTSPNPLVFDHAGHLGKTSKGAVAVNSETMETTRPMVYAGGDAVTGSATVILAMEAGRKAARSILSALERQP